MIGKTNAASGGKGDILGEKLNLTLRTNQAGHSDLNGVKIVLRYADVEKEYTWNGKEITMLIPPYVEYSVAFGDVTDYKTPEVLNYTAQEDNSRSAVVEYLTTVVTASVKSNQPTMEDLADVTLTIGGKTLKNGESVKFASGTKVTPSWSNVADYKTPTASEMTLEGASVTIEGTYETEVVSVSVSADNGESMNVSVTIDGELFAYSGTAIAKKVAFGKTYSVSVSDVEDYITPNEVTYTASVASREVVMEFRYDPATDLSMRDIHGNTIAQNTANCYVVKEAGKYQIPIAYGAAIKSGAANTAAYTNNGGANSHDFVNYLGNVITSPYVEVDTAKQVASVQMSIADMDNAVSELEIVDGAACRYIRFKVNEVPAVGANALISVKDADGVIMWSWHIWLWSDDLTPVEITNATNVKYNILPVNLGSKWDDDTKKHIKNWFYQYGRPNPMLCSSAYDSTTNHANYGVLTFASMHPYFGATITDGIKYPENYWKPTGTYNNWFIEDGEKTYNLWDAGCRTSGSSDGNTIKTVYDPCPAGFKIPNGNVFSGFTKTNIIGSFNKGYAFKRYGDDQVGIFMTASGQRTSDGIVSMGTGGYIWSSAPKSTEDAYRLRFYNGNAIPLDGADRGNGCSVRPVKDDDLALPTHKLTINVSGDTATPSGYTISVYNIMESVDETTGEVTETLGDLIAEQTTASATHEITWGAKYKIVASDVEGFATPSSVTYTADSVSRSVSMVYVSSKLKVNILSNQENDAVIGAVKAVVSWDGASVEVANGESVSAPTNKEITITFPSVDGYKIPAAITFTHIGGIVEKSGTYYTEKLVVNVGADDGSVSGYEITISEHETVGVNTKYAKIDYIEANGNQYIDTGFKPNQETKVVMDVEILSTTTGKYPTLFGSYPDKGSWFAVFLASGEWAARYGATTIISDISGIGRYSVGLFNGRFVVGDYVGSISSEDFSSPYSLSLLAMNESDGVNYLPSAKLYSCQIYDNGTLVRDYIPALREDGVAGLYDAVSDAFYPSEGSSNFLYGETKKKMIAVQTSATGTYKIAHGTDYEVSASDVSGFIAPSSQRFISSEKSRTVNVVYEAIKDETLVVNVSASDGASVDGQIVAVDGIDLSGNGVYIQDINGKLWDISSWDKSVTPNGIAVIENEHRFVLALQDAYSSTFYWASSSSNITGIVETTDKAVAMNDFNGKGNTNAIIRQLGSAALSANYCRNFNFPNGQNGYLGSLGEWDIIRRNKTKIVSALSKCGGEEMSYYYHTSTGRDATSVWAVYWSDASIDFIGQTGFNSRSRAITSLSSFKKVTNGKATFTIPNGVTYEVSVSDKDGYATPASQTFTAIGGTRTVSMLYIKREGTKDVTNGVWIQDTEGYYHTTSEWSGRYTPNGIAVITDNCRFVIALQDAYSSTCQWGSKGTTVIGIVTTNDENIAKGDYKGEENTTTILNQLGNSSSNNAAPAAYHCRAYTFPNGKKGYLGAAGEWQAVVDNKPAIVSALYKCGGSDINNIWTSTQYNSEISWSMNFILESLLIQVKGTFKYVRAFTTL